ncbi:hypothetical protein E2C01_037427 [Portunus trituberculatus]|uniref:Uncharacterized protein n=1 Tax=Portunus trituberculatus TaxID=210409 RepID=A0A5B7FE42_PORTR|nr:hypothetical protein [Portunus trituberculatus]
MTSHCWTAQPMRNYEIIVTYPVALVISVLTKNSVLCFENGCFPDDVLPHITLSFPTPDEI